MVEAGVAEAVVLVLAILPEMDEGLRWACWLQEVATPSLCFWGQRPRGQGLLRHDLPTRH